MKPVEKKIPNCYDLGEVLLINKPLHWTSFDAVRKIRYLVRTRKVGHAGTLDPLATGLLIICTGKYTKKINGFMSKEKEYIGSLTIGATTPSFDLETAPEHFKDFSAISEEQIHQLVHEFTGDLFQVPPVYSAIKKDGRRSYEWARKGKEVRMVPRKICIKELEITGIELPLIRFRTVCSTGTYIRSLAHDMGKSLGVGAYLSSLCRTRIGEYLLDASMTIDEAEREISRKLAAQNG